jgi:PIN domain nuclease of toxin-antitoxin system
MDCLADTVTVIRHFSDAGQIGRKAYELISGVERGQHHCYVSTISLVEILYLSEKNRIPIHLGETLEKLNKSENYSIVDLTPEIVGVAEQIQFPDIFDRLIMATAQYLGIPILTSDQDMASKNVVETIWK